MVGSRTPLHCTFSIWHHISFVELNCLKCCVEFHSAGWHIAFGQQCASNPCYFNGTCTDIGINNYTCSCPPGFTGRIIFHYCLGQPLRILITSHKAPVPPMKVKAENWNKRVLTTMALKVWSCFGNFHIVSYAHSSVTFLVNTVNVYYYF